jgi:hypothetical protein
VAQEAEKAVKRVEVRWEDVCTHAGWHDPRSTFEPTFITQVGYVLSHDKRYLTMVSSFHSSDVGDVTKIPSALVRSIKKI